MKSLFRCQEGRAKIGLLTVNKVMKNYLYEVQVSNYPQSPTLAGTFIRNSYIEFLNEFIHNDNAVSLIDGIK
jgi:hypothetical protein